MRLFYALLPDSTTRNRLCSVAADLKLSDGARLLTPDNFHVTVAYIGATPERAAVDFRNLGESVQVPQCTIELDALEHWVASQTLVLAARKNPPVLEQLTHRLRASIARHAALRGSETRWRAHATLARKVAQASVPSSISVTWASRSFALMYSGGEHGDGAYTVVSSWPLLDKV